MPTAALADILVGDDHPAVAFRLGDHPLDQPPVGLLDVGSARELRLGVAQPQGEGVPDPLELPGREHARTADGADAPVQAGAREGGGEQLAEPALELRDLAPEVVAGPAFGACGHRRQQIGAGRRGGDTGLFERFGHARLLSVAYRRHSSPPPARLQGLTARRQDVRDQP
jgi:hypothetical protein